MAYEAFKKFDLDLRSNKWVQCFEYAVAASGNSCIVFFFAEDVNGLGSGGVISGNHGYQGSS